MHSSVVFAARTNQLQTPLCHFAKQRMASTATFILLFCGSCLLVLSTAAPRNYWQQSNGGYRRKCKAWMHAGTTCHPVHAVEINIHLWAHNEIWVVNNHSLTTCVRTYSNVNIIYTLCTSDKNCVSCLCSEYQINKRCMVLLPEMGGQTSTITTANAYTKTTCSWDSGLRTEQWSSSVRTFYVHDNYATSVWIFSISLPMQLPSTKINLPVAVSTV